MRPLERVHAAAAGCLAALTAGLAAAGRLDEWAVPAIASGLLLLFSAVMAQLARRESDLSAAGRVIVNFYPALTVTAVFELLGTLLPASKWYDGDRLLVWADRALFGGDPTVWMERFVSSGLTDALYLAYASYHGLPIVLGIVMWKQSEQIARLFIFSLTLAFFVNYAGYFLVPALGPRVALASQHTIVLEATPVSRAVHATMSLLEHPKLDAFPSAHAMATIFCLLFSFVHARRVFYGLVPWCGLILLSTVYCRYHYVADVIAGGILAAVLFPLSRSLYHRAGAAHPTLLAPATLRPRRTLPPRGTLHGSGHPARAETPAGPKP